MLSLLYHLNAGDDVPLCKFISSQEGVDHIRGQRDNRVAAEMTNAEMKRLIRMIDKMGEYDYVIFDVGNHIGTLAGFLMDRADVKVVVKPKEGTEDDFCVCDHDEADDASARVINVSLTYDPDSFVEDDKRTYIDIRGKYGRDVSMLAEKIVGCAE